MIRVLIAEDHPMMVQSIVAALTAEEGFEIVGTCYDGEDLVAKYAQLLPDVVLSDQRMPKLSGVEAVRQIVAAHPGAKCVMLSDVDDPKVVSAAMNAGASGFVLKRNMRPDALGPAVRAAYKGGTALDDTTMKIVLSELRAPSWPQGTLTAREIEVITLVSEGMTNREIAAKLHLSEATIKTYLDRVYSKLNVNDRASAVRRTIEAGLIS